MVKYDCPNFFEETEDKYCLVHDDGSYDWVLRGMEHYKKISMIRMGKIIVCGGIIIGSMVIVDFK